MITCNFENRGSNGLCECLYRTVKKHIAGGTLHPDEKMPSKRALAAHLGVSVITVSNAYARLIADGYLYSIEKKGYFVTELNTDTLLLSEIPPHTDVPAHTGEITLNKKTDAELFYADFAGNATSYEKFPFSLWSQTMRRVLQSPHEDLLRRAPPCGIFCLQKAIAEYLQKFRNMNVAPGNIIIGAGTDYLYSLIVTLLGRDCLYAVENPGYHKINDVIRLNGAQCLPVMIDNSGMNTQRLAESGASVVHVSPSHHFPTGIVMPVKRRQELLAWAQKKPERYIIEDDYDSEFRFNGKPMTTLFSAAAAGSAHSMRECVIYVNTFSKTLAPSYRISYMVLPQYLVPQFYRRLGTVSCTVSNFEQYALALFMQNGYYEKHIIRMKNYYRSLRNNLITAITSSPLSRISRIEEEDAGLHFLLAVKTEYNTSELQERFSRNGLRIPLLSSYFYPADGEFRDKKSEQTLVLNYSGIKKEQIAGAVSRIAASLGVDKQQ